MNWTAYLEIYDLHVSLKMCASNLFWSPCTFICCLPVWKFIFPVAAGESSAGLSEDGTEMFQALGAGAWAQMVSVQGGVESQDQVTWCRMCAPRSAALAEVLLPPYLCTSTSPSAWGPQKVSATVFDQPKSLLPVGCHPPGRVKPVPRGQGAGKPDLSAPQCPLPPSDHSPLPI